MGADQVLGALYPDEIGAAPLVRRVARHVNDDSVGVWSRRAGVGVAVGEVAEGGRLQARLLVWGRRRGMGVPAPSLRSSIAMKARVVVTASSWSRMIRVEAFGAAWTKTSSETDFGAEKVMSRPGRCSCLPSRSIRSFCDVLDAGRPAPLTNL